MSRVPWFLWIFFGLGAIAVVIVATVDRRDLGLYTPLERQRMENQKEYDRLNNERLRQRAEQERQQQTVGR